ncbi:YlxR family protein [Microcoleus sp. FACHB-831]|uniref:YlxR family protein n=1 Tax=Microcoleus sp. FACHB-831 TaxID=2692827 RepID=UPI001683B95A|nr:YlxR family protein [Microcoleus sp. FACHB-831]MBD1923613.1 YlxR family protein [Microcoleus sp. FACHB-831]
MQPNYRRCVSCRKVAPKQSFWRIVRVYPSRQLQLDQGMGRSAYLCPQANCLGAARKKNRLGNTLKAPVPEELYQSLWQRLAEKQDGGCESGGETFRLASDATHVKQSLKSK